MPASRTGRVGAAGDLGPDATRGPDCPRAGTRAARALAMRTTIAAVLGALGLCACATSGVGSGRLVSPGKPESEGPVELTWRAAPDATHGTISAILPDGRTFQGDFLQVTQTTLDRDLRPYWSSWGSPWYGWGYAGAYDTVTFVRHYSGRVIAQLEGPSGEHMRCRFVLARPESGPQSGGQGECELSTGERIDYAVLRGERP